MNQILLTEKRASKCRKKIEKREQRREERKLRINKFKLILKNTLKATFRFILNAICVILFKSIFNIGLLIVSGCKKIFGLITNIRFKLPEKRIKDISFKVKNKQEKHVLHANVKIKQQKEKPVFNANIKTESKKIPKVVQKNTLKLGTVFKNTGVKLASACSSTLTLFKKIGKLVLSAFLKLVSILKSFGKLILNLILKLKTGIVNLASVILKANIKLLKTIKNIGILIIKSPIKLIKFIKNIVVGFAQSSAKITTKTISKIASKLKLTARKARQLGAYIKYIIEKRTVRKEKTEETIIKPMNQILITAETALIKPVKATSVLVYKVCFVFSVICSLTFGGLSVYATYDRNKGEEISKNILSNITAVNPSNIIDASNINNTEVVIKKVTSERIKLQEDAIVVILNKETEDPKINIEELANEEQVESEEKKHIEVNLTENGETYYVIATISIPKINVNYPVLSETTDELLKISPCKYWGGGVHEVGNLCIMGHNYVNTQFFSKVPSLVNGDVIELTDIEGNTMQYAVYDKFTIKDNDMSCTSQMTDGNIDLTLITCTNNGKKRVVVKARIVEE